MSDFVWTLCNLVSGKSHIFILILIEKISIQTKGNASADHKKLSMVEVYDGWSINDSLIYKLKINVTNKSKITHFL